MQVHHYDEITRVYLGSTPARQSPMEPGVWLVPAHATLIEPPADLVGMVRVFNGLEWEYRDAEPQQSEGDAQ